MKASWYQRAGLLAAGGAGVLAAVVLQWLLYTGLDDVAFPPYQAGERIIRESPGAMATWAIETLGKDAKTGLALSAVAGAVAVGAGAALFRRWLPGACLGVLVLIAGLVAPIGPSWAWQVLLAAGSGLFAWALVEVLAPRHAGVAGERPAAARHLGRRAFLGGSAVAVALVATGLASWRPGQSDRSLAEIPTRHRLNLPPDPDFPEVEGLSARLTPPGEHYRVDINFAPLELDRDEWRLDLAGMVGEQRSLTFDEIVALGAREEAVFLQCVSNSVGGRLTGNSSWTVVPLASVIDLAAPDSRSSAFVATAADGYHETFPMEAAAVMFVTVGMGGAEIPPDHGHPVRLLYPGHYGMRSVKWLKEIRLIGAFPESYWSERGWEREAVMKVGSRIDAPRGGTEFEGEVTLAGVAWGPGPVTEVEVSYDDGATWVPAQLEAETGPNAWRRWRAQVEAPPGEHEFAVRAHCGDMAQIEEHTDPHPGGATGLHKLTVVVV